jgi:Uma2 family endonuclease
MDTQHGMRSAIVASRPRGLATAADIAHDERLEVVNGYVVSKDDGEELAPARDTRHGMLPSMATSRAHGLATAADIVDERQEVVRGELVQKASPSFEHGDVQGTIFGLLLRFRGLGGAAKPGGWWLSQDVEIELAPHEVYLPDLAGWRIERVAERPLGRPVRMAPDWVCEVISPSTMARDLGHKLETYHRAGVGHYWVAHPVEHYLHVYRRQDAGYVLVLAAVAGDIARIEPFATIELDMNDIFGLPPRAP